MFPCAFGKAIDCFHGETHVREGQKSYASLLQTSTDSGVHGETNHSSGFDRRMTIFVSGDEFKDSHKSSATTW